MLAIWVIQQHFWTDTKISDIQGKLRLLHNHADTIFDEVQWSYQDIVTEILSTLSVYEQWRIHIADNNLVEAERCFISINNSKDTNYWNAQFQIGRIKKYTQPNNNFLKSRLYWNAIPENDTGYGHAQYALGNLWEKYHHHYKNIPIWHKRYHDWLFKLGCITAIKWDKQKAAAYFYQLPENYENSKIFQSLFPLEKNTLH